MTDIHLSKPDLDDDQHEKLQPTIAILRQHPMYDCLVLVKKFKPEDNKYVLELPKFSSPTNNSSKSSVNGSPKSQGKMDRDCCTSKLKLTYLDGDDPLYQAPSTKEQNADDQLEEIVYVPMNGLLSRVDYYESIGVSVDSRVHGFAIGLKTSDRLTSSGAMTELQESPYQ